MSGLGLYGIEYIYYFEIFLLLVGVYFYEISFIGCGILVFIVDYLIIVVEDILRIWLFYILGD